MAKSWEGVTFLTIFRDEKRRWLRLDVASSSSMAFSNDDGERVLFVSPPPNKASFAAENILLLLAPVGERADGLRAVAEFVLARKN